MEFKKYQTGEGKHGLIYRITRGVMVRRNDRGAWVIYLERNRRRKNISLGATKEDLKRPIQMAEKIADKFQDESWSRVLGDDAPKETDFEAYSKAWLENNRPRWSDKTYDRYESILRLFIWPAFTGATLEGISRLEVKRFLQGVLKKRSPAMVELVKDVLSGVYEDAIEEELVSSNPSSRILKRILPPKRMRNVKEADPFTKDELAAFFQQAERMPNVSWEERLILKVMGYAGFRLGEALAMRAEHLDVNSCSYHIVESYKVRRFGLPKKGKKRLVDLPRFLVEELRHYVLELKKRRLRQGKGGEVDLLFEDPGEAGLPFSQRKIQGLMKKVCRTAGLRIRHPHDLRHTYATILLMSHKSPAYVQKQLGHYSVQMTVDIYGHWIPGEGRDDLDLVFMRKEDPKEAAPSSGQNAHKPHTVLRKAM